MNKEERAKINNEVIKALNKLKVNYRLTDNQSSQFNVYINNSLIVYYAVKKTLYYKENRKKHTNPFYDENYENQEIKDLIKFIEKEKKKIDYISKDKIREKIKELEEYQEQHKFGNWGDIPIEDYDFDQINLLKELLEEE